MNLSVPPLRLSIDPANPRHMGRVTLAFLLLHLLLWTLLPGISHRAPPWDNIEQLVWTQSLQWGYYKHPPAPTWWMYAWTELLGRQVWVTFFAAQLSVVGMLWCVWRMALVITTPLRAFVAVVLTSLVAYHSLRGIMANHNTLQLLPVGLLLWAVLAAVRTPGARRWLQWALVGAAAALTLLSKYSALVWFAVIGVWLLQDARMHRWQAWAPVLLAAAIGAAGVAPHIAWLAQSGFAPLRYAEHSVEHGISGAPSHWTDLGFFITAQLARIAPALIALALLRWRLRTAAPGAAPPPWAERRFALFMGLGPLALTLAMGVAGLHLASSWATTFYVLFGLLLLRWVPAVEPARLLKTSFILGVAFQLVLAGGLALGRGPLVDWLGRNARSNFPAPAMAQQLEQVWRQHGHTPLRVLAGETWLAGNVSIHLPSQPLVFIDGDPARAPWINTPALARCDLLVLIDRSPDAPAVAAPLTQLMAQAREHGQISVPWTSRPQGPRLTVDWGIVAATQPDCATAVLTRH
ncbi:MAG: glycosyltransferase family 39 protein [Proteobacteria bacterium]|nr:glycosyltransferase family 39 protein [Pseudomonadota bacterium]